jgi:voltage-gated sodium channel
LPVAGQHVAVLRLLRLLRVLRLVRALPRLQVLVSALFKSIPSMGYVGLLLLLHFYLFGVAASFLFAENDPIHFSSLPLAMLSLFRAVTLEDWTDLMYIQMYGCANYGYSGSEALCTASQAQPVLGAVFFVVFVLLGTMIILNLFIGVIMNGMNDARAENEAEARARARAENEPSLDDDFKTLTEQLASLQQQLGTLQQRVALSAKRRQAEISTSEAA